MNFLGNTQEVGSRVYEETSFAGPVDYKEAVGGRSAGVFRH
jgi:hypothetical protein